MSMFNNGNIAFILVILSLALSGCVIKKDSSPDIQIEYVTLDQGWSKGERLDFYNTSQGSQLIPYSWFLALEQSDNDNLFRDNDNIRRFGYIPQDSMPGNEDGLPIGFVRDDNIEPLLNTRMSSLRLNSQSASTAPGYQAWLGLTCAACHTSEIYIGNKRIKIDGGPPLSDFQAFIENLSMALKATTEDEDKLHRFARKIIAEGGFNDTEKQRLKSEVIQFRSWLDSYIDMNYGGLTTPYGYGRLDAFGAILNRVTAEYTGIEDNAVPANAPTSYPFLWNASQLSWVQWNGSANNHIGRNVGEVLGVFAHTTVKADDPGELFLSSANILNLDRLEQLVSKLESPQWASPLPPVDQDVAARGEELYTAHCAFCHSVRDGDGKFPMTAPDPVFGAQFIDIKMIPLEKIGTDPLMAMNFVNPAFNVDPGIMRSFLSQQEQDKPRVQRAVVLSALVENVIKRQVAALNPPNPQEWLAALSGFHIPAAKGGPSPPNLVAYKARPLNGIWATAPYLHNGSVSSLYQLLLPDSQREKSFYVGGKELDTRDVGFKPGSNANSFFFVAIDDQGDPVPGNSNKGHSGKHYTETREDSGQWRAFTDEERYQLIEFMKTL